MIQVIFKNLERSELAKDAALERMESVVDRFPDLGKSRISVTLSMENSPLQAGPDSFTVKIYCQGGRYKGVTLDKSASNLYAALADVVEHLLERLNRYGDRDRVKKREKARRLTAKIEKMEATDETDSTRFDETEGSN